MSNAKRELALFLPTSVNNPLNYLFPLCRSYAWDFPSKEMQRARILAHILPGCWLDTQALTCGDSIPDVTMRHAVYARCLVVYATRHYFNSPNCLRELLSALTLRKRVLGERQRFAIVVDDDQCIGICKCDKKVPCQCSCCDKEPYKEPIKEPSKKPCTCCEKVPCTCCKKCEHSMEPLLEHLKKWDVKVFEDLPSFWKWVEECGDDVGSIIEWYNNPNVSGRPRALLLTDSLSNLMHTTAMHNTGLCIRKGACAEFGGRLFCPCSSRGGCDSCWSAWVCGGRKAVRFGQILYNDSFTLWEVLDLRTLYVSFLFVFIGILIADLIYMPAQDFACTSGSDMCQYTLLSYTFDIFCLLMCFLVLLPGGIIDAMNARPSTYYTNFLEPLCIAAHVANKEGSGTSTTVSLTHSLHHRPSFASDKVVVVANPFSVQSGTRPASAQNLSALDSKPLRILFVKGTSCSWEHELNLHLLEPLTVFLNSMGLDTVFLTPPSTSGKLAECLQQNLSGGEIVVFLLHNQYDISEFLEVVKTDALAIEKRTVPVIFALRHTVRPKTFTDMDTWLYVNASAEGVELFKAGSMKFGEEILKAISKRAAYALFHA